MTKKILAIFTLFHPDQENLVPFVKDCLAYPGCDVFLSDNAEISPELKHALVSSRVIYHNNNGNLGLGAAQNKGLKLALEKNYDYVVFFDQDSKIHANFIEDLIREFEVARATDSQLIAGGPFFNDQNPKGNQYRKTIISSGTLVYMPFLDKVGLIDEGLFIDYVDTEWCYRARAQGYRIIKLKGAHMWRKIGNYKTLKWCGITFDYHAPFRYYYFFRNGIILMKRKILPWRHVWHFRRHLLKTLFLPQKWERLKYICKGIQDGIRSS